MSPIPRLRFVALFRACLAAALCLSLLPAGPGVRRADAAVSTLDIYTDALAAGWDNWSWATVDLQSTAYAHSGSDSIAVTYGAWTGLQLHYPELHDLAAANHVRSRSVFEAAMPYLKPIHRRRELG